MLICEETCGGRGRERVRCESSIIVCDRCEWVVLFVDKRLTSSDRQFTDSVIACMGDEFLLVCTCGSGRWVCLGRHRRSSPVNRRRQTNPNLPQSFGAPHLDDDAVVGRVGDLVAREDDVGISVELPGSVFERDGARSAPGFTRDAGVSRGAQSAGSVRTFARCSPGCGPPSARRRCPRWPPWYRG